MSRKSPEMSQIHLEMSRDVTPAVTDEPLVWGREGSGRAVLKRAIREHDADPAQWTVDLVRQHLKASARHCERTAGAVGPAWFRSTMESLLRRAKEMGVEDEEAWPEQEAGRLRLKLTSRQVSLYEAALYWPATYLRDLHPERAALSLWIYSVAHRVPYSRLIGRLGVSLATAKRHRSRGLSKIAVGLNEDGVKP